MRKILPCLLSLFSGLLIGLTAIWLLPKSYTDEQNTQPDIDSAEYNALVSEVSRLREQAGSIEDQQQDNQLLEAADSFVQAYFNVESENGFNSSRFYEQYRLYLTEYGQSRLSPLNPELDKTDGISYVSEIVQKTIYASNPSGSPIRAAALLRTSTRVEHSEPIYTLQFIVLDMKRQPDGSWLVNDILIDTRLPDEYQYISLF